MYLNPYGNFYKPLNKQAKIAQLVVCAQVLNFI